MSSVGLPREAQVFLGSAGGEGGAAGIFANCDCEVFIFLLYALSLVLLWQPFMIDLFES